MTEQEWQERFKSRIVERLTVEDTKWTREEAIAAAQAEWEGLSGSVGEDAHWALDENPEDSADESLSYWDDDGDEE